jgi:hypothetical protein
MRFAAMQPHPTDLRQNPFQAPATELTAPRFGTLPDGTPVSGKLYSPGHIAWATWLGSLTAGCVLMAINYRRMGRVAASNVAWACALIAVVAVLATANYTPINSPLSPFAISLSPFAILFVFVMYHSAKTLQGRNMAVVLANGGTRASAWAATGIGLLSMVLVFAAVVAMDVFEFLVWKFREAQTLEDASRHFVRATQWFG